MVSASGFGGDLTEEAILSEDSFALGSRAATSSDRFIYNSDTGELFFDADGNGIKEQLAIASLTNAPTLSHFNTEIAV